MKPFQQVIRFSGALMFSALGLLALLVSFTLAQPARSISVPAIGDLDAAAASHALSQLPIRRGRKGQDGYNVAALNTGWYLDWRTAMTPTHPNNAEYYQVVRIQTAIMAASRSRRRPIPCALPYWQTPARPG